MRSLRTISELFPQARTNGLSEAQANESRTRFGANRLTPLPQEPIWKRFLEKFDEPIIKILLGASLLKIAVDLFERSALAGGISLAVIALVLAITFFARLKDWIPTILFGLALGLFATTCLLGHPSVEGLAVIVAIALATGVAFLAEYRSDREFERLNAHKDGLRIKVHRDGGIKTIPLEDVAVGDLISLEAGDEIPADGWIAKANELRIDQSLMTGESEAVTKTAANQDESSDGPDREVCVYRGTQVVEGLGEMIVADVGDDTMLGQIARRLSGSDPTTDSSAEARVQDKLSVSKAATPLQQKLEKLASLISKVGYFAAAAIFVALLVRGLYFHEVRFAPTFAMNAEGEYLRDATGNFTGDAALGTLETRGQALLASVNALLGYFVYLVIVIVVAVPEGLPMSVTVSLALAMRKMTRANALVRQLVATETIGSATVICTDKTGTLTQNQMRVQRLHVGSAQYESIGANDSKALEFLVQNAALNSTAHLEEKNGQTIAVGSSTEGALLLALRDGGIDALELQKRYPIQHRLAFNSEHKTMASEVSIDGIPIAFVKGAPEVVLAQCVSLRDADGSVRPLTDSNRKAILTSIAASSAEAMRTLAFAHKEVSAGQTDFESGLIFDGFVAIRDPLRPEVFEAVKQCRAAGIEVKMITGDNPETAKAIANELELLDSARAKVLTSEEFNRLNDDELLKILPDLRVLARAKPLDKFRLVQLLQSQNHVVAMTGDGTNDAPSLKKADVGLSMGIAGTEVAKEASQIVLLDDSFGTIVKAVQWGRSLYENIQRFIVFQLTINFSALCIAFLGPFFGLKPPFTVLQLLWINVIMDTFASIALCSEPPRAGLMKVPPKRRDESIVTRSMLLTILHTGGFFIVAMLALLIGMEFYGWFDADWLPKTQWTAEYAKTVQSEPFPELTTRQVTIFFTAYVFFQIWNQINCRSLTPEVSGLKGLFKNPVFLVIGSLTLIGQILIVNFGGAIFAVEPLGWLDWLLIAAGTSSVILFAEISRWLKRWAG